MREPHTTAGESPPATMNGAAEAPPRWQRPDPLGPRIALTLTACALVVVLPFGPHRLWLALMLGIVQAVTTVLVRRRGLSVTEEIGRYLAVEHLLMLVVGLLAPSGYLAVSIVAIGSLGANSPYLPVHWHRTLAVVTTVTLVGPPLIAGVSGGPMAVGAGLLMVAQIAFNRSGTLIRAEEAATAARYQAEHDSLTGLANRRVLHTAFDCLAESGDAASLLLLDIDNFKEVNDSLGHHIGDQVLCEVAARLTGIDPSVLVVRLGGDEFAIIVDGDVQRAAALADEVQDRLAPAMQLEEITLSIRVSIGMAHSGAVDARSLLRFADIAMYRAKRVGRGPTWYRADDDPHSERRLALMQDLPGALEVGHVQPWFQPQVDVLAGRVVGGEALARWVHPRFGVVGADELLEHVELAGLQRELSVAMLRRSLRVARSWPSDIVLSVNVTLGDVESDRFIDELESVLAATGFDPLRLTLEVVEGDVESGSDREIAASAQRIRSLGVSLSLDDFGQAASSLARLDLFDVDELKIDRRFVSRMVEHRRDGAIVDSIVGLAEKLGLRVIAEGIETDEMADAVVAAGIRFVQGYLYGRPAPTLQVGPFVAMDAPVCCAPLAASRPATGR